MKEYWDQVYQNNAPEELGWYESSPLPSLQLIEECKLGKDAAILNVGAGAGLLVDELLLRGYQNIIANDISAAAIKEVKSRLGLRQSKLIRWVVDDIANPGKLQNIGALDLWFDRAVLHFFTESNIRDRYFRLLKTLVNEGGFVIIAAFNMDGALQCSGLPVYRYDKKSLHEKLGKDFRLIKTFDYCHHTPSGNPREYMYTLFQREA